MSALSLPSFFCCGVLVILLGATPFATPRAHHTTQRPLLASVSNRAPRRSPPRRRSLRRRPAEKITGPIARPHRVSCGYSDLVRFDFVCLPARTVARTPHGESSACCTYGEANQIKTTTMLPTPAAVFFPAQALALAKFKYSAVE